MSWWNDPDSPSTSTSDCKIVPNLDLSKNKGINLRVLKRKDRFIEDILLTVSHVVFYDFNTDHQKWSRKDVEGTLFVVKRNAQPRFQFIVLNRKNPEDLVEDILGGFDYEVKAPYLLYRNTSQEVHGIWFFNEHECEKVVKLFSRILNAYSNVPAKPPRTPSKSEVEEPDAVIDDSATNFLNRAMRIGQSSSTDLNSGEPSHSKRSPSLPPAQQVPSFPVIPSSTLQSEGSNLADNSNKTTSFVKPSNFYNPPSPSIAYRPPMVSSGTTSALHSPQNLQSTHGAVTLQPFPSPIPPPSLTADPVPYVDYGALKKEKVKEALLMLVQDNQFIDIVHKALVMVHQS